MTMLPRTAGSRGGPLVMLVLLLTAWTGARALWWENPFGGIDTALSISVASASLPPSAASGPGISGAAVRTLHDGGRAQTHGADIDSPTIPAKAFGVRAATGLARGGWRAPIDPQFAAAHQLLWRAGLREPLLRPGSARGSAAQPFGASEAPPYLAAPAPANQTSVDSAQRWSLDAWAFWRQGSDSAPTSQGRVPIYGASQLGAVLQYRLAAQTKRDPRLYARAYRALVPRGESELALGASARPVAKVPVRIAAEARFTDAAFTNEVRPSAYIVTEIAPIRLPYGARLEVYGQAGWVGGASATAFADGQASLSREVEAVAAVTDNALRLSLGAAAWGGAQDDAQRIDVGPTLRLDLTVGKVPARLSLDWRERVGGAAGPDSGLAATLSTRF